MIRLKDTRHSNTAEFLSSAIRVAEYYGFQPLDEMRSVRIRDTATGKRPVRGKSDVEISFARRDERALASVAKRCVSCSRAAVQSLPPEHPRRKSGILAWRIVNPSGGIPAASLELHIIGSGNAIAEALLLMIADAIARDAGVGERHLSINTIGSHDSSNRYVRDVGSYLRKHIDTISPTLRPRAATDPLGTLIQLIERGHPAAPRAPQSMEYLTEEERRRFWDLLEYLESMNIPYELSPTVLGSRDCWSHSLYELFLRDAETGGRIVFASGGRYDPLASRHAGEHTPAATISILCESRGRSSFKRVTKGIPTIYFAHLGPEARRKNLHVLEALRNAEIPVHQSLLYERIGEQMAHAKSLAVPYILIMGYKEAMEDTVLVREVSTNSQEAVPIPELSSYLKRRRFTFRMPENVRMSGAL